MFYKVFEGVFGPLKSNVYCEGFGIRYNHELAIVESV